MDEAIEADDELGGKGAHGVAHAAKHPPVVAVGIGAQQFVGLGGPLFQSPNLEPPAVVDVEYAAFVAAMLQRLLEIRLHGVGRRRTDDSNFHNVVPYFDFTRLTTAITTLL